MPYQSENPYNQMGQGLGQLITALILHGKVQDEKLAQPVEQHVSELGYPQEGQPSLDTIYPPEAMAAFYKRNPTAPGSPHMVNKSNIPIIGGLMGKKQEGTNPYTPPPLTTEQKTNRIQGEMSDIEYDALKNATPEDRKKILGKKLGIDTALKPVPGHPNLFYDDQGNITKSKGETVAPEAQTELGKLIQERDSLPPDDPKRKFYDAKIQNSSDKTPGDVDSFETAYNVDPKLRGTPQYTKAFEHYKTAGQEAYGMQRIAAMLAVPMSVYDTNTGNFELKTKEEIVQANNENEKKGLGSRYVGESASKFTKPKLAAFSEIEASSKQVSDALNNLKGDFDQKQIAKFAQVLKVPDDGSTIKNFLATDVAKTLTPDEISYVTSVKNLRESSFALRGISGMGQGSDMLRSAIADVIPGPRTPNKAFARSSLQRFNTQVAKLKEGVPGLGAEGIKQSPLPSDTSNIPINKY
jgi:hypothetical protein